MRLRVLGLSSILVFALGIAAACVQPTARPRAAEPVEDLVWPRPPASPRIRYVRSIAEPRDLGIGPRWWQRAIEVFTGPRPQGMVRPVAVAARGQTLAVADPGLPGVHLFTAGRYRVLGKVGSEQLVSPVGVALTAEGDLFISDSASGRLLRVDASGDYAGSIEDTELQRPTGLAWSDAEQRLYVSDTLAHRVLVYDGSGRRLRAFGRRGGGPGEFNYPSFLARDDRRQILVSDTLNFRIVVLADETGAVTGSFGTPGDGSGNLARPKGIAVDSRGHVYVADALFDTIQIFDRDGRLLLAFGEGGTGPGRFWMPAGIYIDTTDRVYVADSYNRRIQVFEYVGGGEP